MKKNLFFLFALALGALISVTACGDKDACADKNCGNGLCVDGTCDCDAGYEYDANGECNVEVREKLIGNFVVSETDTVNCTGDPTPYVATISKDASDVVKVSIANFYASGTISATISNDSKVSIAEQDLGASFRASGNGTIETVAGKTQMTLTYTIKEKATGNTLATCTNVNWTKQ